MKIPYQELVTLLTNAASQAVSPEEARYFAEEAAETHARKDGRTHPLKSAIEDIEACIAKKGTRIEYRQSLPAFFSVDFKSHGPLAYLKKIHDELEERSRTNGIAMVAFTNSQGMHTLHAWVQGLAKRGLVAIAVCNGGPAAVVPFNGTRGLFGTNPMAYGFPGTDGEILCVDMATSEIPYFEILNAHKNSEPLRERSAVDQTGEFTRNAADALDFSESATDPYSNIVPMGGGYKGYYLVFLLEMLTSGLIGMPSSPEMSADFVPEEHGSIIIVFNPKVMGTSAKFDGSLTALIEALQTQKPKAGEHIRIPGEGNTARFKEAQNGSVEVDDVLIEKLKAL